MVSVLLGIWVLGTLFYLVPTLILGPTSEEKVVSLTYGEIEGQKGDLTPCHTSVWYGRFVLDEEHS